MKKATDKQLSFKTLKVAKDGNNKPVGEKLLNSDNCVKKSETYRVQNVKFLL